MRTLITARSISGAALLGALALACTSQKTKTDAPPPAEKSEAVEEQAQAAVDAPVVAVSAFVGADGEPGWLGLLFADHITRSLLVQPSDGSDSPPLYVFGWRQAMSAARSIGAEPSALDARAADLRAELGADHLVTGTYEIAGDQVSIEWKVLGDQDGPANTESTGVGSVSKTAYEVGAKVLEAMAPGAKGESRVALSEAAARNWGESLALLQRQSRDPRATVVLREAQRAKVAEALDAVTNGSPNFAPAWGARAVVASMGLGSDEKVADAAAKAAINAGAGDPSAAISLYYMHQQNADQDDARSVLAGSLEAYPGSLEVLGYLAQAFVIASDYENALEVLNTYMERVPDSPYAARRRDSVLSRMGRTTESVKNAEALAKKFPKSVPTVAALASRQIDAGKMEDARTTLKGALEKNPKDPLLLTRLSFVELESGSPKEALVLAQEAVELIGDGRGEPLAGYAHIDLARAQALSGKTKEAKASLSRALRLGVGGDDVVRLATDPRLEGFVKLPIVLTPEE
ncbi:MAG: tetratricopeptide repeat protein [Myxococcota bacterium]